jgi:signal transduction histidine kinase
MIKYLLIFLKNASKTGTHKSQDQDLYKRIKLCNQICIVMAYVSFPYIFIFHYFGYTAQGLQVIPFVFLFLSPILLNHLGHYNFAKHSLLTWGNVSIIFFGSIFGREAGFQMAFFSMVTLPVVLFEFHQRKHTMLGILNVILCLFFLEIIDYHIFTALHLPEKSYLILNYTLYALTFTIICLSLRFFYLYMENAQKEIHKAYETSYKSLQYAEKLSQQAAYATLTCRIAHEIRTPLAIIQASAELAHQYDTPKENTEKFAHMTKKNIERLVNVTDVMLKYGNTNVICFETIRLHKLIKDATCLASEKCLEKGIHIIESFSLIPAISGDKNKLYQAILNIIFNSIEAIDSDGTITISTSKTTFKPIGQKPTNGALISFTDTGSGIPPKDLNKIFDPFFTTKHEKMGLGLAWTYRVINEHQGLVTTKSEVGKGTTINLYLPLQTQHERIQKNVPA